MQIFHPHLQVRKVLLGNGVGQTGSPLVEQDQAAESRQPLGESPYQRVFPTGLQMRNPPGNHHQVNGTIAYHPVAICTLPFFAYLICGAVALLLDIKRSRFRAWRVSAARCYRGYPAL